MILEPLGLRFGVYIRLVFRAGFRVQGAASRIYHSVLES